MKNVSFINKNTLLLFFCSLLINFYFFYINYDDSSYCSGYKIMLAEPAYDFYQNNSTYFNNARCESMHEGIKQGKKVAEYSEIDHTQFGASKDRLIVAITPWYSVLLGSLWKLTGSLSYKDIIYLQIFLFSFCLMLVYMIAFVLFESEAYALGVGFSTLFFFPLVFHNILVLREIWPFYGTVVLLYVVILYLYQRPSLSLIFLGGSFFAFCQLIRPQLFMTLVFSLVFLFVQGYLHFITWKQVLYIINILIISNAICFWIPFITYNKLVYNRYIVSSVGQTSLEGLGELENKWGYKCCDIWYAVFMKKHFNLVAGTSECDDKAREIFFRSIYEDPVFYIKLVSKRIFQAILPDFTWWPTFFVDNNYTALSSSKERISYILSHSLNLKGFLKMFFSHFYVRFYILVCYIGLLLMFLQGYRRLSLLLLTILTSSWFVIFLHLEGRYILYSFGFIPFCFAYCGWYIYKKLVQLSSNYFFDYTYSK